MKRATLAAALLAFASPATGQVLGGRTFPPSEIAPVKPLHERISRNQLITTQRPLLLYTTAPENADPDALEELCVVFAADSIYRARFDKNPGWLPDKSGDEGLQEAFQNFGTRQAGAIYDRAITPDTIKALQAFGFPKDRYVNVTALEETPLSLERRAYARYEEVCKD